MSAESQLHYFVALAPLGARYLDTLRQGYDVDPRETRSI
jgi:hypothetical protein